MESRLQLIAALGSGVLLLIVLELVRRRRLHERYALAWLASASGLLLLALWGGLLDDVAAALGIVEAPNALFFIAFAAILLLLLHFSAAVSRLADQSKVLAQRLALLEERVRRTEQDAARAEADEAEAGEPVPRYR